MCRRHSFLKYFLAFPERHRRVSAPLRSGSLDGLFRGCRPEKIGNPPRVISTEDMPDSIEPSAGDLTFYAPWGNIAIFYREFRLSRGLVRFGRITSGIEKLAAMHGDFSIAFERAE